MDAILAAINAACDWIVAQPQPPASTAYGLLLAFFVVFGIGIWVRR